MFSNLFNYDNPVWRFMGKFFDVMILNILWIICSIPIVTMGASTTAVYYVTLRLVRDEEGTSIIKDYFHSFKQNFKQSTIIWLILLVVGGALAADVYIFWFAMTGNQTIRYIALAVCAGFGIAYICVLMFVFPLQCRFYNSIKRTIFNAFLLSLRHLFATISMLIVDIAIPLLALTFVPILQPILFMFGFPLLLYINSYFLAPVLEKYMPKKEEVSDELEIPKALLEDEESEEMTEKTTEETYE